jgi:hypothetical protein
VERIGFISSEIATMFLFIIVFDAARIASILLSSAGVIHRLWGSMIPGIISCVFLVFIIIALLGSYKMLGLDRVIIITGIINIVLWISAEAWPFEQIIIPVHAASLFTAIFGIFYAYGRQYRNYLMALKEAEFDRIIFSSRAYLNTANIEYRKGLFNLAFWLSIIFILVFALQYFKFLSVIFSVVARFGRIVLLIIFAGKKLTEPEQK